MAYATLLPMPEEKVEWIRYTGENLEEVKAFCKMLHNNKKLFIATDESKTLYWENIGTIRLGDFVVKGYLDRYGWKTDHIVSWKVFPRMIKEAIPVFLDEYRKLEEEKDIKE
jgi:hypothetical protein